MRKVVVILCLIFIGESFSQDSFESLTAQYKSQIVSANLVAESDFVVTDAYQSRVSGATHIYFSQQLNGLEVIGTESSIHVSRTGDLVFSNERFMRVSSEENIPSEIPKIPAIKGVKEALVNLNYSINGDFSENKNTEHTYFFLSSDDYNFKAIKTQLKYFRLKNNTLKLCWVYLIQDEVTDKSWTILVDAQEGGVLKIADWTQECAVNIEAYPESSSIKNLLSENESRNIELMNCSNCYEVFPLPFESPYDGARQIVISPSHLEASPHGWHGNYDQSGTNDMTTIGNNVWAFDANDNYWYQPDGGEELNFTGYDWSANYTNSNQYEDASITNMFYWINIAHDVLFQYGFDERAGNFQFENFTLYGSDGDAIIAKAQRSPNKCNASFGVGPDGTRTVLTTNICGNKDGNYDSTVILHEFGHGIYSRLTGGPSSTYCLYNDERTTEGVADWYAIMLTMKADDPQELERHIARYLFNRGIFGNGIRSYPYSTDMSVNPHTYNSIKTASVPHGVGEVWATILWELTWELINAHGISSDIYNFTGDFNQDAGNVMALGIVTEAMKLQPCTPGFVTARDAILAADAMLYDGLNNCLLWTAFAKRGLGVNASQGSSEHSDDGTESYEIPSPYARFYKDFDYCYDDIVYDIVGGGVPYGGTYTGPGITDNGDGTSFTLDIIKAGTGTHAITYTIEDGDCSIASSADAILIITADIEPPELACLDNINKYLSPGNTAYLLDNYISSVLIWENCDPNPMISQTPLPGTELEIGVHEITFNVSDKFGNSESCSFLLNIFASVNEWEGPAVINLYPNPFTGVIILDNPNQVLINEIRIFDVNGRLVSTNYYQERQAKIDLNMEELTSGMYFMFIETVANQIIKRVLKL